MMNVHCVSRWGLSLGLIALSGGVGGYGAWAADPGPPQSLKEGMEVLTRGPVHEAFAGAAASDPQPGLVIQERPPQAIEELPPEQRPEGDNVTWIPGYWAWDDERSDFLWVSGVWRNLPPGRQWVPGYWGQSDTEYQWTSGYWADAQVNEIEYLPEPPATVEVGPSTAAPSADQTWVPGSWVWQENRYAWRPGFWAASQPGWLWTPAHYVSTPRGYVFVDGYWDYPVARRGLLFAPVYFSSAIYSQRGFSYSPTSLINPGSFVENWFVRPRYQHSYFGDYGAANYRSAGYFRNRLATPLGRGAPGGDSEWQFRAVDQAERERFTNFGREVQRYRDQRQQWEARAASTTADSVRPNEAARVKLPASPIASKPTTSANREHTPPKALSVPPIDTLVRPQPRPSGSPEQRRQHTTLRPTLQPQQPNVDRPEVPKVQPQPNPKVDRPEVPKVQPQPNPKVNQPTTPRVQPQPKAERPEPQPRDRKPPGPPPSRSNPDEGRGQGKGKSKGKGKN